MPFLLLSPPFSRRHARRSLPGWLALGFLLLAPSGLRAQTTIGHSPVANAAAPSVSSFVSGMTTSTAYIVPFRFNSIGNYSLTSISLLLSGNSSVTSLSLSVSSTLPTDLTAPTALTTFSTTGTLGSTPAAFTFNAGATPTLTAGTTYYLRFAYTGTDTVNWIKVNSNGNTGSGGVPALSPVESLYSSITASGGEPNLSYRSVTSSGFTDGFDNIGGFSITASAIPEPSTYAAIFGAAALVGAVVVRRRRRRRAA